MLSSPESSYEYHHVHAWDSCSDEGKRFDTGRCKSDKIIPATKYFYEISDPGNSYLDPLGAYERYDDDSEGKNREKNRESFRESFEEVFQRLLHEITLAKKFPFAREFIIIHYYNFMKIERILDILFYKDR